MVLLASNVTFLSICEPALGETERSVPPRSVSLSEFFSFALVRSSFFPSLLGPCSPASHHRTIQISLVTIQNTGTYGAYMLEVNKHTGWMQLISIPSICEVISALANFSCGIAVWVPRCPLLSSSSFHSDEIMFGNCTLPSFPPLHLEIVMVYICLVTQHFCLSIFWPDAGVFRQVPVPLLKF